MCEFLFKRDEIYQLYQEYARLRIYIKFQDGVLESIERWQNLESAVLLRLLSLYFMDVSRERGEFEVNTEDFAKSESGDAVVIEEGDLAQRYKT